MLRQCQSDLLFLYIAKDLQHHSGLHEQDDSVQQKAELCVVNDDRLALHHRVVGMSDGLVEGIHKDFAFRSIMESS